MKDFYLCLFKTLQTILMAINLGSPCSNYKLFSVSIFTIGQIKIGFSNLFNLTKHTIITINKIIR